MIAVDEWIGKTFFMKEKDLSCTFLEEGCGTEESMPVRVLSKHVHEQMGAPVSFSFQTFTHFLYLRACI